MRSAPARVEHRQKATLSGLLSQWTTRWLGEVLAACERGQNCGGGRWTAGHGVDWSVVRGGIAAAATGFDERWCARSTRHRGRAVGR